MVASFHCKCFGCSDLEKKLLPSKLAHWLKMTRGIYRKASTSNHFQTWRKKQVKKERGLERSYWVQQQLITCLAASWYVTSRHLEDIAATTKEGSKVSYTQVDASTYCTALQ